MPVHPQEVLRGFSQIQIPGPQPHPMNQSSLDRCPGNLYFNVSVRIMGQSVWYSGSAALNPFILSSGSFDPHNIQGNKHKADCGHHPHFTHEESEAQTEEGAYSGS